MSRVLVVNTGSSSLKLSVVEGPTVRGSRLLERWDGEVPTDDVTALVTATGGVDAVGHRIVHGGPRRAGPAPLDDALLQELATLADLAPLHQQRGLAAARAVSAVLPGTPAVACFDTAFHHGLPPETATYALPREWNRRWGLRRYGFHGLSHASAVQRAAAMVGRPLAGLAVVSCHLGSGASLCAVRGGRSVDTTMGLTPLEGLVMGTRSGSVDPGLLVWLLRSGTVGLDELADVLGHGSGLKGLSGTSGDLRDVLTAASGGDADARLAYGVFLQRLAREAAAMTVAAHGLDLLVITGGIGEHSSEVRADLAAALAHLGVGIDAGRNAGAVGDTDLTAAGSAVSTVLVTCREDLQIAAETVALLGAEGTTDAPAGP